ncbi:MAG: hypothetical protein LBT01_00710 [Spirochaetaceae bacterium]|jgi:hypothetical protein|nr:hypothetical protein [Spirochaetaceae bacterium]
MQISVLLTFEANSTEYTANLSIPTSEINESNPFIFSVSQKTKGTDSEIDEQTVLYVNVAGKDKYYVGIEPPKSILDLAGIGNVVKELGVVVSEGGVTKQETPIVPPADSTAGKGT